ncbi:hypothetical protein JQN72_09255 [Phycicoccus sp. CSK15P-2]|uniref:hypothetical protein n=1 Tax=Phycicoccus sp. CSK15P-2 TaxID=2807627 RepID=UPI00194F80E0|nr:hypothetical protein [Phycicoccus sp. CSK15P-2]MBM6404426.1 hypothetical protein [Phycicoccus sp. CSK15P-2]
MDTSHPLPSLPTRRTALGATALAAAGALALPDRADARRRPRTRKAPETVDLPDGIRPEGITSGPGTTYYVGSLADGRIVTGDLLAGTVGVLLPGAEGRQLRGLFRDERSGLVWAAGNVGSEAHVWAVDGETGDVELDVVVPGGVFLNDLVVTDDTVWVTDSRVDRLTTIAVDDDGDPTGAAPAFVPLSGEWPGYDGTNLAANGIRELRDGTLLLDHSSAGGLWAVDPETGVTTEVPVQGGPGITAGDGIEIGRRTVYVVRGSGQQEVSVLRLCATKDGWTARWRGRLTDETLDVPSTATLAGGWLWAVNARFGVESPDTASYWVTRLPAR